MKQNKIHAIQKNPYRRFFISVEPPRYRYGRHMQEVCEFGYAAYEFACLMERCRLHRGSVPRCYRAVMDGGCALHTREKAIRIPVSMGPDKARVLGRFSSPLLNLFTPGTG